MAEQPSENPKFKLTYFNIRGLGEPIRWLFAYGGIEYEDNRIERDDWPALKATMPFGQMPVLEVDGLRVHQSSAIARYVAKRVGLAGSNDWESLQIDIVVDTFNDFRLKMFGAFKEPDEAVKEKKMTEVKEETLPYYMERLDALAKESGYFANGSLSWADVFFAALLETINVVLGMNLIENYPNLQTVVNNVKSIDSIKAWIESRPQTDF